MQILGKIKKYKNRTIIERTDQWDGYVDCKDAPKVDMHGIELQPDDVCLHIERELRNKKYKQFFRIEPKPITDKARAYIQEMLKGRK